MKFMGLAVPGLLGKPKKDWLTAVWGCDKTGNRFLNYKAYFTILDTANLENGFDSSICLGWLDDLEKSNGFSSKYAPEEWKKFILGSKYRALATKMERYVKSKEEQLPSTKVDLDMLQTIHDFFIEKDNGYSFEPFAADIVEAMDYQVEEINVTNPYKDGGFDAIGKYKVFKASQNEVLVDFYMQAKCYSLDNSIGVKDTARLIARVKDRQFGILFTTSYVANQAFTEIFEDCHPIVIISGKNITDYFHNELEIHDKEGVLEYLKKKYSE